MKLKPRGDNLIRGMDMYERGRGEWDRAWRGERGRAWREERGTEGGREEENS
jgi:hypothetical protein